MTLDLSAKVILINNDRHRHTQLTFINLIIIKWKILPIMKPTVKIAFDLLIIN